MKSAFYFMLIVLVLVAIGFVAFYFNVSDTKDALTSELSSARSDLYLVTSERDVAAAEALDLTAQLSAANDELSVTTDELLSATVQLSVLEDKNAELQEIIKPTKPTHNLPFEEVSGSTDYWNLAWEDADLQHTAQQVNTAYHEWHYYIEGETDCNDMAVDIWDMLKKKGIISLIAVGNLELENETFAQCNHVWIVILTSSGKAFALEPTNGQLYFKGDPKADQYMHFFIYAKPSDLRADAGSRW